MHCQKCLQGEPWPLGALKGACGGAKGAEAAERPRWILNCPNFWGHLEGPKSSVPQSGAEMRFFKALIFLLVDGT